MPVVYRHRQTALEMEGAWQEHVVIPRLITMRTTEGHEIIQRALTSKLATTRAWAWRAERGHRLGLEGEGGGGRLIRTVCSTELFGLLGIPVGVRASGSRHGEK